MRFVRDALITVAVIVALVWVVAYTKVRAGGLSAESQPGRMERFIATNLVRLSIPADAKRLDSPFRTDPLAWRSAADHFEDHCAACHGDDGRGGTAMGQAMYPRVPDLGQTAVQRLSDGELFYVIQNGVRWTGMPAWRGEHSAEETWRLVAFVRRVPTLTHEDVETISRKPSGERHEHEPQHQQGEQHPSDRR